MPDRVFTDDDATRLAVWLSREEEPFEAYVCRLEDALAARTAECERWEELLAASRRDAEEWERLVAHWRGWAHHWHEVALALLGAGSLAAERLRGRR